MPAKAEAAQIADAARRAWGVEPAARLDVDEVCARLGIEVEERRLGGGGGIQALLVPKRSGFKIEVDPEPTRGWPADESIRSALRRHRRRFLLCHELAHTLFYSYGEAGPERLVYDSPEQEVFCDELARSLLVPAAVAGAVPFRPRSVVELQRRFDVSMEVATRSVATAQEKGDAWLLLRQDDAIKVQWTSATNGRTAKMLARLRKAIERAAGSTASTARLPTADVLFLAQRRQAIVTSPA
ncbi:MAG TPA: ImmA/IrrE family metallo-endopeptidase [Solirubrobacterales bacterium]